MSRSVDGVQTDPREMSGGVHAFIPEYARHPHAGAMEKDFSPLVGMEKEEAKRWATEKYPELKVHVLVEGTRA